MTTTRDVGDRERFTVTFTDLNATLADPTTVTINIRAPDGTVTTGTNTDSPGGVSTSGTGVFYFDHTYTQEGRHFIEWTGGGALVAAVSTERYTRRSHVT